MAITTRAGDAGISSVRNQRLRKDALVFGVLGDLDELTSWLGLLAAPGPGREPFLPPDSADRIQCALSRLMAAVAGYGEEPSAAAAPVPAPFADILAFLDREIARLEQGRPAVPGFVNPRGPVHVARAVCRRAERSLVAFDASHPAGAFLNRLSDFLFLIA